ncbi:hypothetical protein FRC01_012762 [Tulasnella sp. 417]|nr:hypothetical protein FRC01_012762 [Tulasnella sp. 417]
MNLATARTNHGRLIAANIAKRYKSGPATSPAAGQPKHKDRYNYNRSSLISFDDDPQQHASYKRVTARELASYRTPPRKVKMLARDFIHDSLYNPNYGYFPKNATIFSSDTPFDFTQLHNLAHFQDQVARRYVEYGIVPAPGEGPGRQVWHTPTELFKPWYGQAIAQSLVSEYMVRYFPYEDFIVYEMGAGNGTLAQNILDYLRDQYPEVYERTRYRIIEISKPLAEAQRQRLLPDHPCVEIYNKNVFEWDTYVPAPCFFLALEVIDNFPHDVIRYDLNDLKPYQGIVSIDDQGDFTELYEPVQDPLIRQFLQFRSEINHESPALASPWLKYPSLRSIYRSAPFAPNVTSKPEFIPTRILTFLKMLRRNFPLHRLLLSDFSSLPDAMPGYNSPVVQTRFRDTMVPVETFMVQPGYFDIFFPTSFELLRDMYELVMSKPLSALRLPDKSNAINSAPSGTAEADSPRPLPTAPTVGGRLGANFFTPKGRRPRTGQTSGMGLAVGETKAAICTHQEFMQQYANLDGTRLRNGDNPLLDYYRNVKFLY